MGGQGETSGLVTKQRERDTVSKSLEYGLFGKEQKRQDKSRLRIGSLNNFRALGQRGCPQLSDTWPWVIRTGRHSPE